MKKDGALVMSINGTRGFGDRSIDELRTQDYIAYNLGKIPKEDMDRITQQWHHKIRNKVLSATIPKPSPFYSSNPDGTWECVLNEFTMGQKDGLKVNCITATKQYQNKSLNEWRIADYKKFKEADIPPNKLDLAQAGWDKSSASFDFFNGYQKVEDKNLNVPVVIPKDSDDEDDE